MKIGELAARCGVGVDTIRFYERRGVLPKPERTASGYRIYSQATLDRLLFARRLQELGFTLDEIIDALAAHDAGSATCASERWRLEAVIGRIDGRIAELRRLRKDVRRVLARCDAGTCELRGSPRAL